MNDEQLKKILFRMGETKANAPEHRTALRAALLREHARIRQSYFAFSTISKFLTMKSTLIPVSTFAVLAFVVIGTFGATQKSAEAQELVERSMARAVQIPTEMRAAIEAQMKADMMETLKEAYAAADLRILTKEEYEKEAQFTIATNTPQIASFATARAIKTEDMDITISGEEGATFTVSAAPVGDFTAGTRIETGNVRFMDAPTGGAKYSTGTMIVGGPMSAPVKYLRYTDPDGRKVTLGLDESDTPVFRIEELTAADVIQGPDGTVGIQGKVLKMINVQRMNWDEKTEN